MKSYCLLKWGLEEQNWWPSFWMLTHVYSDLTLCMSSMHSLHSPCFFDPPLVRGFYLGHFNFWSAVFHQSREFLFNPDVLRITYTEEMIGEHSSFISHCGSPNPLHSMLGPVRATWVSLLGLDASARWLWELLPLGPCWAPWIHGATQEGSSLHPWQIVPSKGTLGNPHI